MRRKMRITHFTGRYLFLSNYFDNCPVEFGGLIYRNSEAAYQAQKCRNPKDRMKFQRLSPDAAKALGKVVDLVPDWDFIKANVMADVVHAKFTQHPELAKRLVDTGNAELIEGNWWHDNFFGNCECFACKETQGQNWLGWILMREREVQSGLHPWEDREE